MTGSAEIVRRACEQGLTIPAFNIPYLPMMQPVVKAAVDQDCFVFITVARLEWTKFEAGGPEQIAREFRRVADLDYMRLHLDHVPVIDEDDLQVDYMPIFQAALQAGYHSLMVDASRLDLAGNIQATRRAASLAREAGVPCEAELGAVLGHEAGPLPPYDELFESGMGFTDVEEAARFVTETQCDWLSVAIGNVHGAVSGAAKDKKKIRARLNLEHLEALRDATGVPLVLHGGSGIPKDSVNQAVKRGIAKVNVATEIRQAYEAALKDGASPTGAQNAVYERTVSLLRDHFELTGKRCALV